MASETERKMISDAEAELFHSRREHRNEMARQYRNRLVCTNCQSRPQLANDIFCKTCKTDYDKLATEKGW